MFAIRDRGAALHASSTVIWGLTSDDAKCAFLNCGSNDPRRILIALLTRIEWIEAELAAMQIRTDDAERLVGG